MECGLCGADCPEGLCEDCRALVDNLLKRDLREIVKVFHYLLGAKIVEETLMRMTTSFEANQKVTDLLNQCDMRKAQ